MAREPPLARLETMQDPRAAEHLLDPLRARLLAEAREPISAAELGERVGQARQKVNYHVGKLAEAGLLERAGERQERGFTAKLFRASARAYLIAPDLLGPIAPDPGDQADAFSAARLLALTARTQSELAQILREAREREERVSTLSIDATVRFASPAQRKAFTKALQDAVLDLVERFDAAGVPGARPFRLVLASHPVPKEEDRDER